MKTSNTEHRTPNIEGLTREELAALRRECAYRHAIGPTMPISCAMLKQLIAMAEREIEAGETLNTEHRTQRPEAERNK